MAGIFNGGRIGKGYIKGIGLSIPAGRQFRAILQGPGFKMKKTGLSSQ